MRVSVQLIDACTDTHLWAEHYDRDVADVLAIQTEIAQQIANQLQARLSPAEKAAIVGTADRRPGGLCRRYTKAREIDARDNWEGAEESLDQKVELLEKATQRDPNFALAYCALAKTQIDLSSRDLEDHKDPRASKESRRSRGATASRFGRGSSGVGSLLLLPEVWCFHLMITSGHVRS